MSEHMGDTLSALLDGQLTAPEAATVRGHVAGCDDCGSELDDVRAARRLVRGLPAVDMPPGFLAELLAGDAVATLGSRRRRAAFVNIAASVAAGLVLLLLSANGIGPAPLQPEVGGAVERHASTISAMQAGGLIGFSTERLTPDSSVPPTTAPTRSLDHLPAPYDAPATLGGYQLVEAHRSPGGLHLVYQRGDYGLSVFELPGRVDWDALPADGTRMTVAGHEAWRWDASPAEGRLVVFEDDGMVVMLVGDEPGAAVLDLADVLPAARSLPMHTRLRRAVAKALELFSPAP